LRRALPSRGVGGLVRPDPLGVRPSCVDPTSRRGSTRRPAPAWPTRVAADSTSLSRGGDRRRSHRGGRRRVRAGERDVLDFLDVEEPPIALDTLLLVDDELLPTAPSDAVDPGAAHVRVAGAPGLLQGLDRDLLFGAP